MKLRRSYSQQEIAHALRRIRGSDDPERKELDWDRVHQQLAEVKAKTAQQAETDTEVLRETWARNAEKVAQVAVEEEHGERVDLLLVRLGRETYGLGVDYIFKVEPAERITSVPRVPNWVTGVVNLRGRIFSVIDLRQFFNLPDTSQIKKEDTTPSDGLEATRYLVIVEISDMEVALLADDVLDVKALPVDHLQESTSTVRGIPMEYVKGIMHDTEDDLSQSNTDAELVVVLDLPALLADERLIIQEEIV